MPKKRKDTKRAASATPIESADPVLQYMIEKKLPLTREKYLALAYPEGTENPLPAELEAELPKQFRQLTPSAPPTSDSSSDWEDDPIVAMARAGGPMAGDREPSLPPTTDSSMDSEDTDPLLPLMLAGGAPLASDWDPAEQPPRNAPAKASNPANPFTLSRGTMVPADKLWNELSLAEAVARQHDMSIEEAEQAIRDHGF